MKSFVFAVGLGLVLSGSAHAEGLSSKEKVSRLFQRLTGSPILQSDPRFAKMQSLIEAGKMMDAAAIATDDSRFYSLMLQRWGAVMSNREENPFVDFNDLQAMVIGVARDDLDARTLLTGNFTYRSLDKNLPDVTPADNDHYRGIQSANQDLKQVLTRVEPQWKDVPDAAGVLTSRAWAESYFKMGTNRRAVEYTFRNFLCAPIVQWKDLGMPDFHVRRDVDRSPGGNPATFQNTCRSCHAIMDSMGGAFAKVDFHDDTFFYLPGATIARKYNQNAQTYPDGYVTVDDTWINFATQNHNQAFGWRGALEGRGLREFGQMISNAEAFSSCLAKRAFKAVCRRDLSEGDVEDTRLLRRLAFGFEKNGYKLKGLFQDVAVNSACLGL